MDLLPSKPGAPQRLTKAPRQSACAQGGCRPRAGLPSGFAPVLSDKALYSNPAHAFKRADP